MKILELCLSTGSIGRINTLFSLFQQVKKEIREAVRLWCIRNLTKFRRHSQNCRSTPVDPVEFQRLGMPITRRYF